jgi:hypothetical protein
MHNHKNISHRKLPQTNLKKDLLEITIFSSPVALTVLEKKIFKEFAVFTGFWPIKCDFKMKVKVKSQT